MWGGRIRAYRSPTSESTIRNDTILTSILPRSTSAIVQHTRLRGQSVSCCNTFSPSYASDSLGSFIPCSVVQLAQIYCTDTTNTFEEHSTNTSMCRPLMLVGTFKKTLAVHTRVGGQHGAAKKTTKNSESSFLKLCVISRPGEDLQ